MQEDDDKPELADDALATQKPAETPAEVPADEEAEGEQTETKAEETDADILAPDDDEGDDEGEADEEQKKGRSQRYRERIEKLRAENEALRAGRSQQMPSDAQQVQYAVEQAVLQEIGPPPNPKEFGEDYVAFSVARQAYETDYRLTRRDVVKKFAASIEQQRHHLANLVSDHQDRVSQFRSKVKDYDSVLANAKMPVAPHVERILLQSRKSAQLAYALGKERDQTTLARLNRMDSESAAREIGRLEGRLSLPPKAKVQTGARKPITPLKGSGASPPSQKTAVDAYIKKLYGNR